MRRTAHLLAALLIAWLSILATAPAASAKDTTPSSWHITRYDVAATIDGAGTTAVTLTLDFDFATDPGHGPFVTLPLRQEIAGDPDHWRMLDVSGVTASSPSGAAANLDTSESDGNLLIKVGDANRTWTGVQTYVITYSLRGLIAPKQATSGLDEFDWNAVGPGWQVPISKASVVVTGPVAVVRTACFTGTAYGTPCASSTSTAQTATFTHPHLDKSVPLQVVAGFPSGTFTDAAPRLTKRYWVGNMFPLTPASGATTGAATLLGLGALWWYLRRNGDRAYAGLTPGLSPIGGAGGTEVLASRTPVAVAFTPPKNARPGEIGTLLDTSADKVDVTATIMDLAVRGYLRIKPLDGKGDYEFERGKPTEDLERYETKLLSTLFSQGSRVTTDDLRSKQYGDLLSGTQTELRTRVAKELKWFRANPLLSQGLAIAAGVGLILAGVGIGLGLAFLAGLGLVGLALIVTGLAVIVLHRRFSPRTAEGSAVLAQSRGFKQYLATAEADQIRFEEGIDVFSRYLPYAIVFGVTAHWVKVFQDLEAQGRYSFNTGYWYYGVGNPAHFADSMSQFSSAMSSSMTAATAASSGGSGFSGGGGFGGGGGGGW